MVETRLYVCQFVPYVFSYVRHGIGTDYPRPAPPQKGEGGWLLAPQNVLKMYIIKVQISINRVDTNLVPLEVCAHQRFLTFFRGRLSLQACLQRKMDCEIFYILNQ